MGKKRKKQGPKRGWNLSTSRLFKLSRPVVVIGLIVVVGGGASIEATHASETVPTVNFHVINNSSLPDDQVQRWEDAQVTQSNQVRKYWGTPVIRFADTGWTFKFVNVNPTTHLLPNGYAGYHSIDSSGRPYAVVGVGAQKSNGTRIPATVIASHESTEMTKDRYLIRSLNGYVLELCDPVKNKTYAINTMIMSDFVTRAWFVGGVGPYDEMDKVTSPGSVQFGYATLASGQTVGLGAYQTEADKDY